jgi:hypothetical protein
MQLRLTDGYSLLIYKDVYKNMISSAFAIWSRLAKTPIKSQTQCNTQDLNLTKILTRFLVSILFRDAIPQAGLDDLGPSV